jgi:hypothetical protein
VCVWGGCRKEWGGEGGAGKEGGTGELAEVGEKREGPELEHKS